jgi:hypothetical protein
MIFLSFDGTRHIPPTGRKRTLAYTSGQGNIQSVSVPRRYVPRYHLQTLDLPGKFGVQPPKPPAMQPWGLRVACVYDPAGVLWHFAQRRDDAPSD